MSNTAAISRRDFFRLKFLRKPAGGISEEPSIAKRNRRIMPLHRPPGAVAEEDFLAGCTKCDACAKACPHDAIVRAPNRFGDAAGTPVIDVANAACQMCEDMPCIAACDDGVLRDDLPVKMGEARINQTNCLAYQSSFCSTCSERCPVEGAITTELGKPIINTNACTGCGVCANVCPAPVNAIIILPEKNRPRAGTTTTVPA